MNFIKPMLCVSMLGMNIAIYSCIILLFIRSCPSTNIEQTTPRPTYRAMDMSANFKPNYI